MIDVIIIGAGIIGLITARNLALAGFKVVILEQNTIGKEASWAGGGIISPLYPWRHEAAVTALASWSQQYYPKLVQDLFEITQIDAEFNRCGLLILEPQDIKPALTWALNNGYNLQLLTPNELYSIQNNLACGFKDAIWSEEFANIRNPRLLQALVKSLKLLPNVNIIENTKVEAIIVDNNTVTKVITEHKEYIAQKFLVAAGAWSQKLLSPLGVNLNIMPVKGQMLLFKADKNFLKTTVLYNNHYLIPRVDGHILAGSTLEYVGFDKKATPAGFSELYRSALAIIPELEQAQVVGHWAGLRPGNFTGIPFMGIIPGIKNLYLSSGHYRNGLVLAPASGKFIADLISEEKPIFPPAWFEFNLTPAFSGDSVMP